MAFFPPAFLDDLRSRLRISEVVGRKVKLRHKTGQEYTGLCPFHNEKTPSFTVSDLKGFYHCFGCGAHGDVLRFVTETERLSFTDVVTQLAQEAGLPLPTVTPEAAARYERALTLYDVMEAAAQWCETQLRSPQGQSAQEYIHKRGLPQDIVAEFRLGYAPDDRHVMPRALTAQGFSQQQMLDCGLLTQNDRGEVYARFRDRLMFPIQDAQGRVVAFGGRILGDGQPKYLNSPATDLFHKGEMLFNWHRARPLAAKKSALAVVEGYMDTIAMAAAGIMNVVAPLGTALTEAQVQKIWQVVKEPTLCLDGDAAGARAMAKAATAHLAQLKPGYGLKFARLPEGQDPDDVIAKSGVAALKQMLGSAIPLSEALWQVEFNRHKITTPEEKADLEHRLFGHTKDIPDLTVRKAFEQDFRDRMWQLHIAKRSKNTAKKTATSRDFSAYAHRLRDDGEVNRLENILLYLLIHHPFLYHHPVLEDEVHDLTLTNPDRQTLKDYILAWAAEPTETTLQDYLEQHSPHAILQQLPEHSAIDASLRPGGKPEIITQGWQYLHAAWHSAVVEAEFQAKLHTVPEEQLWALKNEKDAVKKLAEAAKNEYIALLDTEMGA